MSKTMGACTFSNYGEGSEVRAAFKQLTDAAAWEYGHGGYTGTIAEKRDFVVIRECLPVVTPEQASAKIEALIDNGDPRIDDKWGPAGAIPVGKNGTVEGWVFFGWASS